MFYCRNQLQSPILATELSPIAVNLMKLFCTTVGCPPGAALYCICGVTVPEELVRRIPRR